ncbi:hypothetical protein Emag_001348 [Eimeria magna]
METASLLAAPNLTLGGRCGGAAPAATSTAAAAARAAAAAAAAVAPSSPGANAEGSLSPAVAQALQETREKTMLWLAAELELLQRLLYKQQQLLQQLLRQTRPLLTHEQPRLLPSPPPQQQQQQQVEGFTRALDQLLAATADTQLSVHHAAAAASQLLHLGYHVGVVLPLLAVFGRLAALGVSLSVALEQQLRQNPEQLQQHLLLHSPAAAAAATTKTVVAMTMAVARAANSEETAAFASRTPQDSAAAAAAAADAAAAAMLLQWSESCRATCEASPAVGKPEAAAAAARVSNEPFQAAGIPLAIGSSSNSSSSSSPTLPRKFVAYAVSATPRLIVRNVTEDAVFREWAAAARGCAALDCLPDSIVSEGLMNSDGPGEDWSCNSSSNSSSCCRSSSTSQQLIVAAAAAAAGGERGGELWEGQLAPQPDASVGIGGQCT